VIAEILEVSPEVDSTGIGKTKREIVSTSHLLESLFGVVDDLW
jgi:hypothetical protein